MRLQSTRPRTRLVGTTAWHLLLQLTCVGRPTSDGGGQTTDIVGVTAHSNRQMVRFTHPT